LDLLTGFGRNEVVHGQPLSVSANAPPFMAEVDPGNFKSLFADILPDVQFRPVAQREDTHVFAGVKSGIVEVPDLRALILRVPLTESIAKAEEALLRARLLLIASSS